MRQLTLIEQILCEVDTAIRTIFVPQTRSSKRKSPASVCDDHELTPKEKKHVAGLMRVNHAGEVCAQALYQGQALTAQLSHVKMQMEEAAAEEIDHLAWCENRLNELGSKPSVLNGLWYGGSLMLGALAGLAGDRWSLGFVAETERQVSAHLQKHLHLIPSHDLKTKHILTQMHKDETHHAETALAAGGAELPAPIKQLMGFTSLLMTKSSYYL